MKPVTDGYAQANGLRLHYEAWPSDGPTVVCLHGTSLTGRVWSWLAKYLNPEFSVIGLDQRGHGDSDTPALGQYTVDFYGADLAGFADAMSLPKFSIVGSSLGSRTGLHYAAAHPERVEKLVFLDLSFEMPKHASDKMIEAHVTRPRSFADLDEALAFSQTLPQRLRFSDAMHLETLAGDLAPNADGRLEWRYNKEVAIETLSVAARDMWDEVRRVTCPTLILRGELSDVLTPETAERMPKEFRNGRVLTIPGAGHSIWGDNPRATAAAISTFLRTGDFDAVQAAIDASLK